MAGTALKPGYQAWHRQVFYFLFEPSPDDLNNEPKERMPFWSSSGRRLLTGPAVPST